MPGHSRKRLIAEEIWHAGESIACCQFPLSLPTFTTFDPLIGHIKDWLEARNNYADTWFRCLLV